MVEDHLGSSVQVVGILRVKMIAEGGIVEVVSIEAEIGRQVVQKTGAEKHMAVGKLLLAENTALVKLIHNPHLVEHHEWLGEQYRARHYSTKTLAGEYE